MDYSNLTWNQLRKLATDNGIKAHGKGRADLEAEIAEAGIDPAPPKMGKPSWKPARMLDVEFDTPGYRKRWVDNDPANIRRKQAEGWVFVNKETGFPAEHKDPGLVHGGAPLDSSIQYRDVVLMALPEDTAQARDEYYAEINKRQLEGVNETAAANMQSVGPMATTRKGNLEITRIK